MIPLRDANPSTNYPVVNNLIISTCVVVYLVELSAPGGMGQFVHKYGLVPARLHPFAFLSFMFMHGGFWHLLSNMWILYIFGDNIEDHLGSARYLAFYLLCGLVSGLAHILLHSGSPGVPVVGASGAIAGVMGAYMLLFPHAKVLTLVPLIFIPFFFEVPALFFLGLWFAMQLLNAASSSGISSGVAWWAHVGGFLAGMALLRMFKNIPHQGMSEEVKKFTAKKKTPRLQVVRPGGGAADPNLYGQLIITNLEAMTGATKTVNIPWGVQSRLYRVIVPPGTKPGARLRLKGLGKRLADGTVGDVYLKVSCK